MTDDDELDPVLRDQVRAALGAVPPPADFAAWVAGAGRARARRAWLVAACALAAAAAAALIVWSGEAGPAGGALAADRRVELAIGGRAVAVAEPGAALTWAIGPGGVARVVQRAGDVFYRVDPGGAFVVATPAGEVAVEGTCFRVEVTMTTKSRLAVAAAAGAALAAGLTVTVYEGRVRVVSARGEVRAGAGERVVVDPTSAAAVAAAAPGEALAEPPPGPGATRDELLARDAYQRTRVALLEAELVKARRELVEAREQARAAAGAGEPEMIDVSPDEWKALAQECGIRYVMPPLDAPARWPDDVAGALGLTRAEAARVQEVFRRAAERHVALARALYIEATGDRDGADNLSPSSLWSEIIGKAGDDGAARRRVALEQAGEVPRRDDASSSIAERFFRSLLDTGAELERELAAIVGPERARQLRTEITGNRGIMSGCDDG